MQRSTSRESRRYHGLGGTPTYRSWYSMIERCSNPKNASWKHYGAKGIRVCERWLDLESFVADMGLRPEGMSIDRRDRSGNYEPSNCQWATDLEQQRNRGGVKCTAEIASEVRALVARGVSQGEVAKMFGISRSNVSRIHTGGLWRTDAQSQ